VAIIPVPYHIGIVVRDVAESQAQFTELLGLRWCQVQRRPGAIMTSAGRVETQSEFTYSQDGPPYIELLRQQPNTPWAELGLNHLAYWTDVPADEGARFSACGFGFESVSIDAAGVPRAGLYHKDQNGVRIELVEMGMSGPKLTRYLAGDADYA
jgi:catechol 2,3-dioxygenase-like lactoylglutathione lyase family enzyme